MEPKKLELTGFLSYKQEEIDFDNIALACIVGENGSGKSSIMDAITWALFGIARHRGDNIINSASDAAQVIFEFEYESSHYRIQRSKKRDQTTILEFQRMDANGIWRPLTGSSVRETETFVRETLNLNYETFTNAAFFLQGEADNFSQQRPSDRKRILGTILGLDAWEEYRVVTAERRRETEMKLALVENRLESIQERLDTENDLSERVKTLQDDLIVCESRRSQQEVIVTNLQRITAEIENEEKRLTDLQSLRQKKVDQANEIQMKLQGLVEDSDSLKDILERKEEVRATYKKWEKNRNNLDRLGDLSKKAQTLQLRREKLLGEIRENRARLQEESKNLDERKNTILSLLENENDVRRDLAEAEKELDDAKANAERKHENLEKHQDALQKKADVSSKNETLKIQMDELKERIDQLTASDDNECPLCEQDLQGEKRSSLISRLEKQGKQLGDQYRENKTELEDITQCVNELKRALDENKNAEGILVERTRRADQLKEKLRLIEAAQKELDETITPRIDEINVEFDEEELSESKNNEISKINHDLQKLGYDPEEYEKVRKAIEDLNGAQDEMRKLDRAIASNDSFEREIASIKEMGDEVITEANDLLSQIVPGKEKLKKRREETVLLPEAESMLAGIKKDENKIRIDLGAAENALKDVRDLREEHGRLIGDKDQIRTRCTNLRRLEKDFGAKGVPALLIEQALPEIEGHANQTLERISDGAMSVRFITQQAYKDESREDLRETLDIQISDSHGMRGYEMYSGGEQFRIDFSIRLALSKVLAKRAGARLRMLLIDEGFGSQDENGRQRLVQAINMIKDDFACIMVITHLEELKELFPTRIEVRKSIEGSTIEVK